MMSVFKICLSFSVWMERELLVQAVQLIKAYMTLHICVVCPGEISTNCIAPAIANAVAHALAIASFLKPTYADLECRDSFNFFSFCFKPWKESLPTTSATF
jgi:hypothetical protein